MLVFKQLYTFFKSVLFHYAECHHTECRYVECRDAKLESLPLSLMISLQLRNFTLLFIYFSGMGQTAIEYVDSADQGSIL
jgi:hypothetical protein